MSACSHPYPRSMRSVGAAWGIVLVVGLSSACGGGSKGARSPEAAASVDATLRSLDGTALGTPASAVEGLAEDGKMRKLATPRPVRRTTGCPSWQVGSDMWLLYVELLLLLLVPFVLGALVARLAVRVLVRRTENEVRLEYGHEVVS